MLGNYKADALLIEDGIMGLWRMYNIFDLGVWRL
jgi:hypothetical protein